MKEKQILKIFANMRIILLVFMLTMFFSMYIFTMSRVSGSSMQENIFDKDMVFLSKILGDKSNLNYGEIIVIVKNKDVNSGFLARWNLLIDDISTKFNSKKSNKRIVKRIVAKSGDKVVISDGELFVNEVKMEEPYINQMTAKGEIQYPYTVPKNSYFVLGDNREISEDSRFFGAINENSIEGKVAFRFFPFTRFGKVK